MLEGGKERTNSIIFPTPTWHLCRDLQGGLVSEHLFKGNPNVTGQ